MPGMNLIYACGTTLMSIGLFHGGCGNCERNALSTQCSTHEEFFVLFFTISFVINHIIKAEEISKEATPWPAIPARKREERDCGLRTRLVIEHLSG